MRPCQRIIEATGNHGIRPRPDHDTSMTFSAGVALGCSESLKLYCLSCLCRYVDRKTPYLKCLEMDPCLWMFTYSTLSSKNHTVYTTFSKFSGDLFEQERWMGFLVTLSASGFYGLTSAEAKKGSEGFLTSLRKICRHLASVTGLGKQGGDVQPVY
jgi:hypothetical protein